MGVENVHHGHHSLIGRLDGEQGMLQMSLAANVRRIHAGLSDEYSSSQLVKDAKAIVELLDPLLETTTRTFIHLVRHGRREGITLVSSGKKGLGGATMVEQLNEEPDQNKQQKEFKTDQYVATKFTDFHGNTNIQFLPFHHPQGQHPPILSITYDKNGEIKEIKKEEVKTFLGQPSGVKRKGKEYLYKKEDQPKDPARRRLVIGGSATIFLAALAVGAKFGFEASGKVRSYSGEATVPPTDEINRLRTAMDYGMVQTDDFLVFVFGKALDDKKEFDKYIHNKRKAVDITAKLDNKGKAYPTTINEMPDIDLEFGYQDDNFLIHRTEFFHNGQNFIPSTEKNQQAAKPQKPLTKTEYDALVAKYQGYGKDVLSKYFKFVPDNLRPINDPSVKQLPSRVIPVLTGEVANKDGYPSKIVYTFWSNDKITAQFFYN